MPEYEKTLSPESMYQLERDIPSNDHLNERLGVGRHYGSIETVEEKHFPWLKMRRQRRKRRQL